MKRVYSLCLAFFLLQGCARNPESQGIIHAAIFHEVSPTHLHGPCVSPDYFRDVLEMIRIGGKKTLAVSEILNFLDERHIPPDGWIALTFDDGWVGVHEYALPLLLEYRMRATLFATTDSVDEGPPRYCSWNDLQELSASGLFEIYSHSVTHADFKEIDDFALQNEMIHSLEMLKKYGFPSADCIAYPFGHCDKRIQKWAKRCGYRAGFAAGSAATIEWNSNRYSLARTTICQLFDQELVCRKLGLDFPAIRRDLAIYDEEEGTWNSPWDHVQSDPNIPRGLYGSSYIKTQNEGARWWIDLAIDKVGRYSLSLWTPMETEDGPAELDETGFWLIHLNNDPLIGGPVIAKGMLPPRKKNGWTEFYKADFIQGTYRLALNPKLDTCKTFIVDALKIERLSME